MTNVILSFLFVVYALAGLYVGGQFVAWARREQREFRPIEPVKIAAAWPYFLIAAHFEKRGIQRAMKKATDRAEAQGLNPRKGFRPYKTRFRRSRKRR